MNCDTLVFLVPGVLSWGQQTLTSSTQGRDFLLLTVITCSECLLSGSRSQLSNLQGCHAASVPLSTVRPVRLAEAWEMSTGSLSPLPNYTRNTTTSHCPHGQRPVQFPSSLAWMSATVCTGLQLPHGPDPPQGDPGVLCLCSHCFRGCPCPSEQKPKSLQWLAKPDTTWPWSSASSPSVLCGKQQRHVLVSLEGTRRFLC